MYCIVEHWSTKFDSEVMKFQGEIEIEKSKYQKLLSEKRSIEERLEKFEQNAAGDNLKHNSLNLSLPPYQENGYTVNDNSLSVSYYLSLV